MPENTTAALYLRTSTQEQHTENQRPDCLRLAAARNFEVVEVYEEQESAAKERPVFDRMLTDAKRGKFRVLILWDLSRFGRTFYESLAQVGELDRLGVRFVSAQDPSLDTTNDLARHIIIAIRLAQADAERKDLIRRTKAGLARVAREEADPHLRAARRAKEKKAIGRPRKLDEAKVAKVRELRGAGQSWNEIATAVGVSVWTCMRAVA